MGNYKGEIMFALCGVAKDITMYSNTFRDYFTQIMLIFAPEHCYKHGTAVVKNTGMSKVLCCI